MLSRVGGEVTLELTLDEAGNVVDSRALSGPLELRQEAVRWSLDWRYDTAVQPARRVVATVSFALPKEGAQMAFSLLSLNRSLESIDFPPGAMVLRERAGLQHRSSQSRAASRLEPTSAVTLPKEPDLAATIQSEIVSLVGEGDSYTAVRAAVMPAPMARR
ncbi:MAG: hypothetical protein R2724_04585 [Bryobacterales bacterium]